MANSYNLDNIFGYMPFDHFLVEKWDSESPNQQEDQERDLIKAWINLGRHGRSTYYDQSMEVNNIPIPNHIPSDLLAFERRRAVDPDEWSPGGAIWIRTWYGNEASSRDVSVEETITRTRADEAYLQLWRKALSPPEMHGFDDSMFGPCVFDDGAAAHGVLARDADDEVELMEETPSFILNALMRCPDAMKGCSKGNCCATDTGELAEEPEGLAYQQELLVVVADGEACEDGWVLLIAINHKGQVLHKRTRCKAFEVGLNVAFWRDGGEPLDVGSERENVMDYRDWNQSGNVWDEDEPL